MVINCLIFEFPIGLVDMAPLYEALVASKVLNLDQKALDSMRAKIADELKKLDEKWVLNFDKLR